jgi:hypothetical protein
MSEIYDSLSNVVAERQAFTADAVLNLRTGGKFTAEIETNLDPFTLPEAIASDPREKIRLHVTDDPQLNQGDLVQVYFGGKKTKFKVVGGYFSNASITSKFIAIEIIGKDQA